MNFTKVVGVGDALTYRESTCPFCGKEHVTAQWLNVICPCGAKFYVNTHEWLDRNTGRIIKVKEEV